VRDDGVFVKETFFDQDLKPVRVMSADKIAALGGRAYPVVLTMRQSNKANQWTRITTTKAAFDVSQPSYLFTKSNLQNPRD
jgi:hypothetical protein